MKRPLLIKRKGNKFVLDEAQLFPYLRKSKDLVIAALTIACNDFKQNPHLYETNDASERLQKINDKIYSVLKAWGIYKD